MLLLLLLLLPLLPTSLSSCPSSCSSCLTYFICTSCYSNYFLKDHKCDVCPPPPSIYNCLVPPFNYSLSYSFIPPPSLLLIPPSDSISPTIVSSISILIVFTNKYDYLTNPIKLINLTFEPPLKNFTLLDPIRLSNKILELPLQFEFSLISRNVSLTINDPLIFFDSDSNFLLPSLSSTSSSNFSSSFRNESILPPSSTLTIPHYFHFTPISSSLPIEILIFLILACFFVFLIFFIYKGLGIYVWVVFDFLQSLNLLLLLNVETHPVIASLFGSLSIINFAPFSHFLYELSLLMSERDTLLNMDVIPYRISSFGRSDSFFYNSGDLLLYLFISFSINFFLLGYRNRLEDVRLREVKGGGKRREEECKEEHILKKEENEGKIERMLIAGSRLIEWKVMLKFFEVCFYHIGLGIILRLKYLKFSNAYEGIDVIISCLVGIVSIYLSFLLFKKINHNFVFLVDREHYRKYDFLFQSLNIRAFPTRNLLLLLLLKKLFTLLLLLLLIDFPFLQILFLLILHVLLLLLLLWKPPFVTFSANIFTLFLHLLLSILLLLFLLIQIFASQINLESKTDPDQSVVNTIEILSWMIFGFAWLGILWAVGTVGWIVKEGGRGRREAESRIEMSSINSSKRTLKERYNL